MPISQPTNQQRETVDADHERVKNIFHATRALGFRKIKKQRRDEEKQSECFFLMTVPIRCVSLTLARGSLKTPCSKKGLNPGCRR
jgi:hypothetical protein